MSVPALVNRDIIMIGIQPWDFEIGCNFKDMAYVIARHNRVIYVNRPLDRVTAWRLPDDVKTKTRKQSIERGEKVLEEVEKNLWVFNPPVMLESINWLNHGFIYRYLNKRNNRKQAAAIEKALQNLSFKNPVLFIDNDFFNGLYLQDFLNVSCTVYYLRDFLLAQPYFSKHGVFSEPELIKKADLVVANSLYLTSYARQYNNNCFYIGQGCGDLFFKPVKTGAPADIQQIKPPIIGYCGFLTSARLDIKLLGDIAKARPEWSLVLVGPEDDDFKNSDLHTLKNIFFMGRKNEPELPAYVSRFNVCLNPQLINQLTIGNYPRKVDEYLAMGKPVVATATETMEAFAHCTYLCNGSEAYISAIEKALAEDDAEKQKMRRDVAESHSWENSINLFYNAVAAQHK
ncbi:MAG: glycosyltransferase [Bacteroidetes bacterium]|nr:glycosyltransferase [Bacteroidota bacterium]MBS1924786.1 glycosyltransferase [Bacteroidota bacterium]MCC6692338.1 glycosyltransferase [Chitinophagaceae bacterium]